jgi:HlyD family secretion protein
VIEMSARLRRIVFWGIPVLALVLALAFALRPRPFDVDLVPVVRGPLVATVAEEGETRIKDVFVLYAPIRGRALRIEIEEGAEVVAGETVVAEIEPIDPEFLDLRTQAEMRAAIETARAALTLAQAQLAQARAELEFATAEVERMRTLYASRTVSIRALEDAERTFRTRGAAVETADAAVEMRESELSAAQVRLLGPEEARSSGGTCPCIPIHAPVNGQVLRVLHESEGVVEAGQPLVEIGNPGALEVVVDFLSTDAVRIDVGNRVIIEEWGGEGALQGRVARIEPFGFTKVSALGIEEQRVNVVIDFTDPPERWRRLGHGFQVEARVVLWEDDAALKVPNTALFRDAEGWAVFVAAEGRADLRPIEVGHQTDLDVEILSGLSEGEEVIRYPSDSIEAGIRIRAR